MSSVHTTATTFSQRTTFLNGLTAYMPAAAGEALRLIGANRVGQIMQSFDFTGVNPIEATNTDGLSLGAFGDRIQAYPPGDVFNSSFRTLTHTNDSISTNASGIQFGHGTGVVSMFWGTGAPGAAYPKTNGMPADGSFYFRLDGGSLTTIYQARVGAWVGIV